MSDFEDLDPHMRSYALVGCFLQNWALMERSMHKAIAKALDLESTQATIVCANIQFRDKINILKTAVNRSLISPRDIRDGFIKTLNDMSNYAPIRNMMAHDLFMASEDEKGVEFLVTKAKGKLDFPQVIWTVPEFKEAYKRLAFYNHRVDALINQLQRASLWSAILKGPPVRAAGEPPSDDTFWQGLLGLPVPPPQAGHTSATSDATPETEGGSPPDRKD